MMHQWYLVASDRVPYVRDVFVCRLIPLWSTCVSFIISLDVGWLEGWSKVCAISESFLLGVVFSSMALGMVWQRDQHVFPSLFHLTLNREVVKSMIYESFLDWVRVTARHAYSSIIIRTIAPIFVFYPDIVMSFSVPYSHKLVASILLSLAHGHER